MCVCNKFNCASFYNSVNEKASKWNENENELSECVSSVISQHTQNARIYQNVCWMVVEGGVSGVGVVGDKNHFGFV